VRLERVGPTEDGSILFSADAATLEVGTYQQTFSCGGTVVDIEIFVYSQIGGARGEANSISRLATAGSVLALVTLGLPRVGRRRVEQL
jgi:hypothetical protein